MTTEHGQPFVLQYRTTKSLRYATSKPGPNLVDLTKNPAAALSFDSRDEAAALIPAGFDRLSVVSLSEAQPGYDRSGPVIYEVEDRVFSGDHAHLLTDDRMTLLKQQDIADQLVKALGIEPITVERARGTRHWALDRHIGLLADAGPAIVAHEVAHILTADERRKRISHGPEFRVNLVRCVRVLSEFHADRLQRAIDDRFNKSRQQEGTVTQPLTQPKATDSCHG